MPSLKPSNAPMAVRGEKLKYGHFVLAKFEFGQALYWPEPTKALNGQFHEPEIGDVGYIDEDGAFQVLFNVSHSADHESHAGPPPLPGNFVPLDYDRNLVEKKERFCTMGPLYSSGVRSQRMQGLISADVPNMPAGGTISYRFKCSRQQGAFLMLWDDATKVVVQKQERKFEEYMLDHHQKWVDYATDTKYLGMRRKPEDIILVRGTVKTSSWTVGAFIGDGREDHEVALEGRLGPVVNVSFQYSVQESSECSPVPPRSGPAHRVSSTDITTHPSHLLTNPAGTPAIAQNITDKKDQCVFLSFYKMKYRRPFPRQIRAAADVLGGGGGGDVGGTEDENSVSEYSVDVETESSRLLARSPLDHILDYILENSHAAVAITSHEDLLALNLNTDDDWPSTFPKLLRQVSPEVVVDSSGAGRLFITGTSMIRHAQAVEASQTNTLFPLDQARLALSSTTWSNSEEPNQAIVNTAQMNQLTHLQRHGIFLPLTSPAFESDFKEWCNKNNIQINRQLLNLEDGKQINLHKLHAEVIAAGTVAQLGDSLDRWAIIGGKMGFVQLNGDPPRSGPAIANRLLHVYREYLQQFDLMYLKSSLQKKLPQTGPAAQQPDMNSGNPPAGPSNPPGAQQHEGLHNNMQGLASLFSTADPNGIEELLNWSRFSSDELRAMNVPQDIIIMIDINRPTLTRQPSTQAQFQEANNNINASITMQQQQLTGPSGTPSESNAQPGHIATGTIQQQQQLAANQSRMRKTPLKAIQGPSGMQPLQPQNNAQPNCMAMPSRTMNPAPEDFRRATATAQRLRQEARAYRAANIPPPVMIPEVNRSEYNKRFEQLVRSITDLDNKLPFVMMVFAEIVPKMLAETTATVHLQRQILRSNTPRYIIDDPSLRQMSDMVGMVQEAIMKRMQGQPQFTSPPQPQLQPPFPQPQVSNPPNATMHVPSAGTPPVFTDPAPYYPLYMPPPLAPLPQPQLSPRPQPTPAPSVASTKKKQRGAKNTAFPAAASTSFANAPTATQVKSTPTPKASEPKSMAKPVPERKALAKIPLARPLTMSSLLASTATASVSASNPVPSAAPGVMDKSSSRAAAAESTYTKRRRDEEAGSSTPGPMHTSKKARVDWIQSRPVDAVLTKKKEKKKLVQPNDYSDYSDESAAGFGALSFLPTNDLALDRDQKLLDLILKHSDLSSFSNAFDEEAGQDVHENSDAVTFLKHEEESDKTRTNHHSAALVKAEEREDALWFESEEDGMKFSQDKQKGVDRWHSPTSTKLEDPEEETHDPRKQLSEDARRFIRGLKKIVVTLANPSESELEKQEEEVNALRTQFGADIDSFFSSMKSAARSSRDQNFAELTKREESPGSLDEDVAKNSARSTLVKDEKVTSDPYGNFVEKREEAGASLQMM